MSLAHTSSWTTSTATSCTAQTGNKLTAGKEATTQSAAGGEPGQYGLSAAALESANLETVGGREGRLRELWRELLELRLLLWELLELLLLRELAHLLLLRLEAHCKKGTAAVKRCMLYTHQNCRISALAVPKNRNGHPGFGLFLEIGIGSVPNEQPIRICTYRFVAAAPIAVAVVRRCGTG